jgi:hypothetical protein
LASRKKPRVIKNPAVPGHAFSTLADPAGIHGGVYYGKAYCKCGASSGLLNNHKKRMKWFNDHKDAIRRSFGSPQHD